MIKGESRLEKMIKHFYSWECQLLRNINHYFDRKQLNIFFRTITHCGGATFTISLLIFISSVGSQAIQFTAFAGAISLAVSHLPVAFMKKMYPRERPYLVLDKIKVTKNPLVDHSFPSGHTTAIFSILIPYVLLVPLFAFAFIPFGLLVGISRIYLGLHFPTDVFAGIVLGSTTGLLSFLMIRQFYPYAFW